MYREMLKKIIPPIFIDAYRHFRYGRPESFYGYFGNYPTWQAALKDSSGYDSDIILNKVLKALSLVKDKKAVYERDSVLLDKVEYCWPLLSALLWIAALKNSRLSVIDFGGSLGSSYYQNISFLSALREVKWNIIEQPKFVECGKKYFENERLKFYFDIDSCVACEMPDVLLLSGVIEYVGDPYALIEDVISRKFEFIIIDRTIFFDEEDRITVQRVPPSIYDASYPCRIFNRRKFLERFSDGYDLIADFEALGGKVDIEGTPACYEGYIFRRK